MNSYTITFTGRLVGSEDRPTRQSLFINEETAEQAIDRIYEDFEEVSNITVRTVTILDHFRK